MRQGAADGMTVAAVDPAAALRHVTSGKLIYMTIYSLSGKLYDLDFGKVCYRAFLIYLIRCIHTS